MVLKESRTGLSSSFKRRLYSGFLNVFAVVLCVGAIAIIVHESITFQAEVFNPSSWDKLGRPLVIGLFIPAVMTWFGLDLFTRDYEPSSELVPWLLLLVMPSIVITGMVVGFKSAAQEQNFEDSIVQKYKQEHHLDKVKVKREKSEVDESTHEKMFVYRFTQADGKSEFIAYRGHEGNEPSSQKTLTPAQFDKLMNDHHDNGEWR